jgi:hypothetical protein
VRLFANMLLWILIVGVPVTLAMLPLAIYGYRFSGMSCAFGKGMRPNGTFVFVFVLYGSFCFRSDVNI